MSSVTLTQAIDRVRDAADCENQTDRHPDTEITGYLNRSRRLLVGRLARLQLLKTFSTDSITATGAAAYTLSSDFFAVYSVWQSLDNGAFRRLHRHTGADFPFGQTGIAGDNPRSYDIAETSAGVHKISFLPQPSTGTFIVQYIAAPTDLASGSDTFVFPLAWDEWVILDAAIQVLSKDDLPWSHLAARKQEIEEEIDAAASSRDLLESAHIRDVRSMSGGDPADHTAYQLPWVRGGRWRWP